jgi:Transposase DDE domain
MSDQAADIKESDLRCWRLLDQFRKRLALHYDAVAAAREESKRKFFADDYFSLLLFSLFNPALKSTRALCHASGRFERMREVCSRPVSIASFSEGQHAFDPEILASLLRDVAKEAAGRSEFGDPRVREAVKSLTAVDGTVLRAVNRMAWCFVGCHGSAVKLHLHFSVFDQAPADWTITPDRVCERKTLKHQLKPGAFYVADRLYGHDYAFMNLLTRKKADFVFRISETAIRIGVSAQRPLSERDQAAGVVSDRMEQLGDQQKYPALRVVEIHSAGQRFLLATNRHDLPADLIGEIYRYRWQIELFFKWFKTILGCGHWMAESPRGVAIQLYCALIASLLLMMGTAKRPTKRQMEAITLYFSGFVTEEELVRELNLQKSAAS